MLEPRSRWADNEAEPGISAAILRSVRRLTRRTAARWKALLRAIGAGEAELQRAEDHQLRKRSLALRYRARSGEPLERLLPEAYALVREAARRTIGMRPFDVQLLGGIALFNRSIVEMLTGEGKTLTATLPLYLIGLQGKGCHLATVNDYLARRDAQWMGPVYEALGLSVGVIQAETSRPERRRAYACDVTYGTAKEFGFDFLRDRLLVRWTRQRPQDWLEPVLGRRGGMADEQPVQRPPHFALVDEADSILIDEARTPLIISAVASQEQRQEAECCRWSAGVCQAFAEDEHYELDPQTRKVQLTAAGRQKARQLPKPQTLAPVAIADVYQHVERAILVDREYHRDRQYVVRDREIVIVDEFTGRLGEGRKWRDGIHQAIEAKEQVEVTVDTGQAARITVQDFFLRYARLAGMTGTARSSARELRTIYKCRVVPIPTRRPVIRKPLHELVLGTAEAKWTAVVDEAAAMHQSGRPVLIGTRSIDKSVHLSRLLEAKGIEHQVLNAHKIAEEAEIVAGAGERGKVTVSTNMAGRGTDIILGDGVAELGGLHVICTEMHDSARIDRQLRGRCGRQGDPGTYRQFLALDDELLETGLGSKAACKLRTVGRQSDGPLDGYARLFRRAQRRIERRHFRARRRLMYLEQQRKEMHRQMGQDPYLDTPG